MSEKYLIIRDRGQRRKADKTVRSEKCGWETFLIEKDSKHSKLQAHCKVFFLRRRC